MQSATAEQLAEQVQDGRRDLIPDLWEKVRRLYDSKARTFYRMHAEQCRAAGLDLDDLRQIAFFGFLGALDEYDRTKGLTFAAFINYPLLNALRQAIGTRGGHHDAMQGAVYLDSPTTGTDGDEGGTLADFVPDPESLDFVEALDAESVAAVIRAEVDALTDAERDTIQRRYFAGETLQSIANRRGVSLQAVHETERKALRALARRKNLRAIYAEQSRAEKMRALETAAKTGRAIETGAAARYAEQCKNARAEAERARIELETRAAEALQGVRDLLARIRAERDAMPEAE